MKENQILGGVCFDTFSPKMDGFHGNHHFSHFHKKYGGHWRGDHFEKGTFYN